MRNSLLEQNQAIDFGESHFNLPDLSGIDSTGRVPPAIDRLAGSGDRLITKRPPEGALGQQEIGLFQIEPRRYPPVRNPEAGSSRRAPRTEKHLAAPGPTHPRSR